MNARWPLLFVPLLAGIALVVWLGFLRPAPAPDLGPPRAGRTGAAQAEPTRAAPPESSRASVAPEPSREPAPVALTVRALAAGDLPVAEVEVHAERGGELRLAGETGRDGRLRVPGAPPELLWLRHPRHVTTAVAVPAAVELELVVHLEPAASIAGRVEVVDGSPLPQGVLVTALPARDHSPHGTRGRAAPDNPRIASTRPGADGRFELLGLAPEERYVVRAGAPGWIVSEPALDVRPGEEDLALTLWPLYGFRLRLVGEDGAPPRTDPRVTVLGATSWRALDDTAVTVSERFDLLLLAGVEEAGRWLERPHWYVAPRVAERVGPISLRVQVAGYAPVTTRIWAERVRGATVPATELRLRPLAAGWGELVARFEPAPPELDAGGRLELISHGSEVLDLTLGSDARFALPAGSYRWRYVSASGAFVFPPPTEPQPTVDVRPGATSELVVERRDVGSLAVELRTRAGLPHRGKAILRLGRADREHRGRLKHLTFERAPYVLRDVPAGTWDVAAITGTLFSPPGFEEYAGAAEVRAGELATLVLDER